MKYPLRLFWIRHAPPVNPDNICYGADIDVDVSDTETLQRVARALPGGAQWFVTPMSRTLKTAQAIIAHHPDSARVAFQTAHDLREQSFGDWVGMPRAVLPRQPGFAAYIADMENTAPPGGESLSDLAHRVGRWMEDVVARHPDGGDIILVAHKGTIRAGIHYAEGVGLRDTLKIAIDPLSLTTLVHEKGKWTLAHSNLKP